jgi:hypothetical protein
MRRVLLATLLATGACAPTPPPPSDGGPAPTVDAGPFPVVTDPLSMPASPTLRVSDFVPAAQCGACHQDQYAAWRYSTHAYAMVDPVFQALVGVRQQHREGAQDRFCLQCHSAIATRGGEVVPNFRMADLSPMALEGITCDSCHRVSGQQRDYNSGHILDPGGPVRGGLPDVTESTAHASETSQLLGTSRFCGGCHDVREVNDMPLERPYAEWLESPAASTGKTCQSCHMPLYDGQAGVGGPQRQGLHGHRFVGVDIPLKEGFAPAELVQQLTADVETLLAGAATLTLSAAPAITAGEQLDVSVSIRNNIDAHNLPTGTTFMRQLWLELTVMDSQGTVLYATGTLDGNGDLRDHFSSLDPYGDHDLITLGSGLINAHGDPELFPWRATEHISQGLSPLYTRTYTLFVPTRDAAAGPLSMQARLRFRSHPPFLLRALGLEALVPRVLIHQVASAAATTVVGE